MRSTAGRLPALLVAVGLAYAPAAFGTAPPSRSMLGIELGAKLDLPDCGVGRGTLTSRPCINRSLTSRTPWGADEHQVALPRGTVPSYVRGQIKVVALGGVVESIQVGTWGLQSQDGALKALTAQFGAPTKSVMQKKPAHSRFAPRTDDWDFADFSVRLDGSTGSIDWGLIEISTHRYRKLAAQQDKSGTGR